MKSTFRLILLISILLFPVFLGCQQDSGESKDPAVEVKKTYHKNGNIESETEMVNGVREGMHRVYYEDGALASEIRFVNDKMEGKLKAFYQDGSLKMVANYKNGILNGETKSFYPDGSTRAIQKYENNKLVYHKQYGPEGEVEFEEKY